MSSKAISSTALQPFPSAGSLVKKNNNNCKFVGRAIGQYCSIGFGVVSTVTFIASLVFGGISASYTYIPPICFIAAIISLSLIAVSLLSLIATVTSAIVYGFFDSKIKNSGGI